MVASVIERPVTATGQPPRPVNGAMAVSIGLLVLSGVVLAFGGYLFGGSALAAQRTQDVLYTEVKKALAEATAPVAGAIPAGTPLGVVEIPHLGLEQVFLQGSASEQTMQAPGLVPSSSLPGQAGVSVLVGRRSTFGAPFRNVDDLRLGDQIHVTTGQGRFTYVVDLIRTSDSAATDIKAVTSRLTLITSDPMLTPTRTLQVSARLKGDAQPRSAVSAASADDVPGEGSTGRGISLLLWAQLLLVATALVTWAALRLNPRVAWIGGAPVLLAILWNVFENLAVLLPNTL
jgi:sortase A